MAYRVDIMSAAERDLRRLPRAIRQRIDARMRGFTEDPRPRGVEPVRGTTGLWRLRVGDYRVIFAINDTQQVVTIARVRHRGEVYRGL